jgi:hypothetical protein
MPVHQAQTAAAKSTSAASKTSSAKGGTPQQITGQFDKQFPWDNSTYTFALTTKNGATQIKSGLPAGSAAAKMFANKSHNYDYTDAYKATLAGQPVLIVAGTADATYDVAVFNKAGKQIAFQGNEGDGVWQYSK